MPDFDTIIERSSILFTVIDEHRRITYQNNTIEGICGHTPEQIVGNDLERVGVIRDVTERKARERALEQQNERLEEFASIVSHDLRNPLSVAKGWLELAQTDCDSDALEKIETAHSRMGTLIADLLTLAREGKSIEETEAIDLRRAIERGWQSVDTGQATLRIDIDQTIHADGPRVQQLLENLIRNAIEHGGRDVTVSIGDLDDGFFIADDGPRIPESKGEQVFKTGYSTAQSGTGFGLGIVERIVNAHGWEIDLTDSCEGGARFEIRNVNRDAGEV